MPIIRQEGKPSHLNLTSINLAAMLMAASAAAKSSREGTCCTPKMSPLAAASSHEYAALALVRAPHQLGYDRRAARTQSFRDAVFALRRSHY